MSNSCGWECLGAEDLSSPYSVSWITNAVGNGITTARARDAEGNIATSTAVNVTVNNVTNLLTAMNFNEGQNHGSRYFRQ